MFAQILPIDLTQAVNGFIMGFVPLMVVVASYFVNRWLDMKKKQHADAKIEVAITEGIVLAAINEPVAANRIDKVLTYVEQTRPLELKTVKLEPAALRKKVTARVAASRSLVI